MNAWQCECWTHREEIYDHLGKAYNLLDWQQTAAVAAALLKQKWFNPLRPLESLLLESLKRACCEQES